jgi:hypothetical protein
MKKLILVLVFFLLINFVSAVQLVVSPAKLEFEGNTNEKMCKTIQITSDFIGEIITNSKWSDFLSNNINDYQLIDDEVGVVFDKEQIINSNEETQEKEICFTFEDPGEYHGALLFNTKGAYAGVGIWIKANINGESKPKTNFEGSLISNKKILSADKKNKSENFLYFIPTVFLVFIFGGLLFYYKKKNVSVKNSKNIGPKDSSIYDS